MALIECPKCKKEISDKAEKCVHCGYTLKTKMRFCSECGSEFEEGKEFCPKCGCPVKSNKESNKQYIEPLKTSTIKTNTNKWIPITIALGFASILIVIGIIFGVSMLNKKNAEKKEEQLSGDYESNLETITFKMLDGGAKAENCGNKIIKVWSNTIMKEDDYETDKYTKTNGVFNSDFNVSLSKLFADRSFIKITDEVEENQEEVSKLMKKMKNPPTKWKDAYSDLREYYDNYLTLTDLCINPTGSYTTYSSNFREADSDTLNSYRKMQTYLDS